MILLDTNVIIDLFGSDEGVEATWSRRRYAEAQDTEVAVCNHVVLAELLGQADLPEIVLEKLNVFRIEILDLSIEAAASAGSAYRAYRDRGGRKTILPDFLIGGHAVALGASLMTRDRRLASYFPTLPLVTPETHP